MRANKKPPLKSDKTQTTRSHKRGVVGYSRKTALLEEAITQMNAGKYGRSSAALKELLALDPHNMEARRLFATLHLRLGSLIPARQAFDSLISEAFQRQDYWLAESLLREYLAAGPRCVPYLEKLGSIYQEKGAALEAVAEYGKAIDILIEDPDPDNPHYASDLYAKIRELAPASPVAFRLTSFFDAQTGELLARQSSDSGQSTVAATLDMSGDIGADSIPSGTQMDHFSEQVSLGDSHPSDTSSTLALESSETQPEPDPTVSIGRSVAAQEQDRLLAQAEPAALHCVSGPSMVSVPMECVDASEPPTSSAQSIEATATIPPVQIEATALLGTEPSTTEPIAAEDRQLSLQQPVETNSKEVVTEPPPDTRAPSNPNSESVSPNEISEPWKQPGFSWESVFNSAWKFGNDHAAHISPSEVTKANVEDAPSSQPTPPSLKEQVLENQTVEIPEREASTSLGGQTSSVSPIAPMPWDQVQESVISILPTKTEQSFAESTESIVERSAAEADSDLVANRREDQAPPSITPAETETFSIAPVLQTSASLEPEISAELRPVSIQTEGNATFVEPEQPPAMSAVTVDGPSLDAPMAAIASPFVRNTPVANDVVVPSEVPLQRADSVSDTDNDCASAAAQSAVQEPPLTPSQPTSETLSNEIEEISILRTLQKPQVMWESPEIAATPPLAEETTQVLTDERQPQAMECVEERPPIPEVTSEPVSEPAPKEELDKAGDSIRFIEPTQASPLADMPSSISERQEVSRSMSGAAAAVDVFFESSRNVRPTETREPPAEPKLSRKSDSTLSRIRIAIAGFVGSCFSTTRAMVVTCVGVLMLLGVLIVLGIGAIGLTWIIMEESPSPVFQSLTTTPQRTLSDFKNNGYFLFLGIDAPSGRDPIQEGYDRKAEVNDGNSASVCFGGPGSRMIKGANASADVMRGWVRSSDPIGEFKSHQETIKRWGDEHQLLLNRYSQWKKLPFEDWGYGRPVGPPCTAMAFAHQLHVAEGFLQGADPGVDRLETDMEAWRIVLGQAKTLAVKMLALQAINDDIAVASGLLLSADFDGKYLGRVTKFLRPFDQTELSLRWPMQSELVSASKTYETQLNAARAEDQSVYTMVISALPLPAQRRLNDYADYYDASYKTAGEGRYGSLPKWKNYIHFPASGLTDYFTNPIENIVGLEPLAPWDRYNGFVVDTDAHLRLASLQAWIRRGSGDGDLLTRIAKAGQNFYDPYTGLPMLVNMKKGVLYSVGHDGKDQDADPQLDVFVEIPGVQASLSRAKSSTASFSSR
ncbi:MAG: hypothetical protein OJF51_001475 [Nitrospira sp.]|nr:MAG: hypothetical protein OJF51_001475 [Nitrospira sp.]